MTLAKDEIVFLTILLVNLVVALLYFLAGILFLVPAKEAVGREEGEEIQYDNRRTFLLRFLVMLLCPVIGPLFFFLSHVVYLLAYGRDADLADVIFSKERVQTRMKADEETERNIIPLEEAVLINEKKNLRMVMMNVIKEDIKNSLAALFLALDSEDSESSHYAAAVLSDELNKFRVNVQKLWLEMKEETSAQTECEEMLLDYMDGILKQHIFSVQEQWKYMGILENATESLYQKDASRMTVARYTQVCLRTLESRDMENCRKWCLRMEEQYPEELSSYTCRLKFLFAANDRGAFFETLEALKKSHVVIDNETLELIRVFS